MPQLGDVTLEVTEGVAELTLNRPTDNALTADTANALTAFLLEAPQRSDVRAVLITASGTRFCVGADPRGIASPNQTMDHRNAYRPFARLFDELWRIELPVVAAVNGTVAGAGWLLALLGDLVYADQDARWTHVYARRGLVPHAGDPYYLSRLIPFRRLMEIALLSEPVTSPVLEEWNAITRSLPAKEVLPTAREQARRLAAGPTRTFGAAKQLYRRALDQSAELAAADERATVALISTTDDRAEGMASFLEGRAPKFTGH